MNHDANTLTTIEKVLLLQDEELFQYAYSEHLSQLAALCRESSVEPNVRLFSEKEPCRLINLLVEGRVRLERHGRPYREVERGGLDCWSFFSESAHLFSATTLTHCQILTVTFEGFTDLLTAEPEFCWAVLKRLAQRGRDELAAACLAAGTPDAPEISVPSFDGELQ